MHLITGVVAARIIPVYIPILFGYSPVKHKREAIQIMISWILYIWSFEFSFLISDTAVK